MSPVSQRPSTSASRRSSRLFPLLTAIGLVSASVVAVSGCPIYSADSCAQDPNCVGPQPTAEVDTGVPTDGCDPGCPSGYVCSSVTTGRYQCLPYDCRSAERACSTGQTCTNAGGGVYTCSSADAGPDTSSDAGSDTADSADTKPPVIDCTTTGCISGYKCADDGAGGKVCTSTDPNACAADGDCTAKTGAGSLCLGGLCKAAKDLCTDSTQCLDGKSCVDGRCIAKCTATSGCASGYTCDTKSGTCVGGASACGATGGDAGTDGGASCSSTAKCVATHCVDKCATDGSCRPGLVCVAGGCVPNDQPSFFCDKDGTKDGVQDLCATGSICLHHNCYLACTGSTDTTTCAKADKFPVCKSVTTSSGAHDVCGSSTNLGTDCDPTTTPPKACATGKVCIDGFCK